jgi:hypothetical protein
MGLKKWLSKSGVSGIYGTKIIDEINPLKEVIEHPDYPLARIYRTSFWRGIKDTYDVLMGEHYSFKGRKGVLDLLIFPLISRICLSYSLLLLGDFFNNDTRGVIFKALEVVPCFVLIAIGVLTLILTPIVAVVHAVTYPQSKRYKEEIQKLEGIFIDEIKIDYAEKELLTWATRGGVITSGCIKINAQNEKIIEALLATNVGNILSLSLEDDLHQLKRWLDSKEKRLIPLHLMVQEKIACTTKNISLPPANFQNFADQIKFFADIAVDQEATRAQNAMRTEPP